MKRGRLELLKDVVQSVRANAKTHYQIYLANNRTITYPRLKELLEDSLSQKLIAVNDKHYSITRKGRNFVNQVNYALWTLQK